MSGRRPEHRTTRTSDHHVLADPAGGSVVRVRAGARLEVTFPHRGVANGWRVAERPGHVVPIGALGWGLHFLVFGEPVGGQHPPLRLVRTRGGVVAEVRELTVVVTG